MEFLKLLLFPFAFLYGLAILIRNWFYDSGVLPSAEFNRSVIVIGNLSAGGTGKTPMIEYLVRLLKGRFPIATLSRGYKRHTSGFLIADKDSTSHQIGDEPLQFKKKFPELIVSVDENRKNGIQKLIGKFPELKVLLLDDAFQHRRVKPGLSILLSDYGKMFYDDFLLPVGTLREWRAGKKRADIIVATKCPDHLTPVEKRIILKKINPEPHQYVLFSHIKYGEPVPVFTSPLPPLFQERGTAILLTGISNPRPLEDFLLNKKLKIISLAYPDHHEYTLVEATRLIETFNSISSPNKFIIITEKDAMRLDKPGLVEVLHKLPMYYIPIETTFDEKEKKEFDQLIINYIIRTEQKNNI
ncbi:MAG: tetraacyldisaccharide 4'-kinase [Bacteroidetes bacterium]|nr:MAG: tetraacyldisaccharide 4'-kinase [Bacteroidota bacterium]